MGKRMTKKESEVVGVLVVIALIGGAIIWFFQQVGFIIPGILVAIGIGIYLYCKKQNEKERVKRLEERRAYLREKYGDDELVSMIMNGSVWQEQTDEQLIDSLGSPDDIDQKVLKTKKKEVWKYYHQGGNRYGLRITLDNDLVIGWDEKM